MSQILEQSNGRYNAVVGFAPTGWAQEKMKQGQGKIGQRSQSRGVRGTIITYQVPYSEHSSYNELVDFVSWFK